MAKVMKMAEQLLSPDDLRKYRTEFRANPDVKSLLEFEAVRKAMGE